MCVVICNTDNTPEDAGTTYLNWENGRHVPVPPLFYVPGLRPIFQKQSERTKRHAASTDLGRTCALPRTYCAGRAYAGAQGAAIFGEGNLHITAQDSSRRRLYYQPATQSIIMSTNHSLVTVTPDSCNQAHINGNANDKGHVSSQQCLRPASSAVNKSPPLSPSSQSDPLPPYSCFISEWDMKSQKASQKIQRPSSIARRPLTELSSFNARNKFTPKTMSSTATGKQPALGSPINKSAMPLRHHASTSSSISLKSILKRPSSSTSKTPQGRPQRKKSVRFPFDLQSNGPGVGVTLNAATRPRRLASVARSRQVCIY
jgi:hypothetical protein